MKRKIEKICNNCKLYDPRSGTCRVVILHEGTRVNLPVDRKNPCFFEQEYFDPITQTKETFNEIQEVKFWVEDKDGKKTDKNGTVKIEYPENFFGNYHL